METIDFDTRRVRTLKTGEGRHGPIVYLMARDQRVGDNWALLYAQQLALIARQPLVVAVPFAADYPRATWRQVSFMIDGLQLVQKKLRELNIEFTVIDERLDTNLPKLIDRLEAGSLVTDFSPLRESRAWKSRLKDEIDIPFYEVDTHNIVPAWFASDKAEYAAYTFRPKIHRLLPEFLTEIPRPIKHPHGKVSSSRGVDWDLVRQSARADGTVDPVAGLTAGETAARERMERFLNFRLEKYADRRNDPNAAAQSDLSPYLHFGQLSAQRVVLEAERYEDNLASQEAFLEELIVRRELSDNYCLYNEDYDSFEGFPDWARKTLDEHRGDPRPYLYSPEEFELAVTHDELWNAAQREMVHGGKMHGYMRMYWAKKILEWSPTPEDALATAISLNDRYELDGHDPNGYAGVAWSIGGVHDRPWFEREIFGKVRYMSEGGCRRKFDVPAYIESANQISLETE